MMTRILLVALSALAGFVLFGAAGALGMGAVLVNLFTPFPAAMLGMRSGIVQGVAAVLLTALAVLATAGGVPTALYLVQFGLPAVILPSLLLRGIGWDRATVVTLGLMLAAGFAALLVMASGSGQSALDFVNGQIVKEIDQAVVLMNGMAGAEQSPAEAETFRGVVEQMAAFMRVAYPGMLVVVCGAMQLVTIMLLALTVRPSSLPGAAFAGWRSPEMLIWVLIAAGFAAAFGVGSVQAVAINALIVLLPVYFLQGLAVVEHFLRRKGFSTLVRGIGYMVLLLINPLPLIVTGVGVFDLWADFRKPRPDND